MGTILLTVVPFAVRLHAVSAEEGGDSTAIKAVFLGVENYGHPETCKENRDSFRYRFLIDSTEKIYSIDPGPMNESGTYGYPIQNVLKEGYPYMIQVAGDPVVSAREIPAEEENYTYPVGGIPGLRTVKNVLETALEPVGTVLYMYGGGWDWQDEGAGIQTRSIGLSSDWLRFFREHDASYTYRNRDGSSDNEDPPSSYYPYGKYNEYYYAGLDCSGYMGWVIYNVLDMRSGLKGYVTKSSEFARNLAGLGLGTWSHEALDSYTRSLKPGDIVSMDGHVWMAVGTCSDGSVVILHSTPSMSREGQPGGGVQIGAVGWNYDCEAYLLAEKYMSEYYPDWYARYPAALKSPDSYLAVGSESTGVFSWDTEKDAGSFSDPEGIQKMTAGEVLQLLFSD